MNSARLAAEKATVSVVIPVKDDSVALARCLRALKKQTRNIDEIIVVDNGSSDSSANVATAAGATVVTCEEPGIPAASAHGYDLASGDFILRLDADCVPSGIWVQSICEAFVRRPDVAVFTGGARFIDGPKALRGPIAVAYLASYVATTLPALGHLPVFGSNLAMRREVWRSARFKVHRHDQHVHDDLDLAFHIGERYRIRYLADASMGMSMRPFNSARSFALRLYRGFRTVLIHWPADFAPVRWVKLVLYRTVVAPRRQKGTDI
ncbi:glycosyltransferase family 2 protein [Microbacterium sp. R86528]|uniref:glycosyltransferase family 2 protein n=1 Tax=Microbacterium sp. R86528 TaxID=3093864 RepID=UPI0037C8FB2E